MGTGAESCGCAYGTPEGRRENAKVEQREESWLSDDSWVVKKAWVCRSEGGGVVERDEVAASLWCEVEVDDVDCRI